MITISLCMIVKNEQAVLARCLDSVRSLVDEIIIVDTGSEDETKEIASKYTHKVYDFLWINDFSAARNFAYSKASMDYQMWLDADDIISPDEKQSFLALKQTLTTDVDMVTMKYHTHFDREGNPTLTSTRERLTRRDRNDQWQDPIHECIPLSGKLYHSDIAILHKKPASSTVSTRNLDIYEALEADGKQLTPRQQYYFARELKDHGRYAKAVYYFERFLEGGDGWVEDNIAACFSLSICYNALHNQEKMLPTLLKSFQFDTPRAEICCELGYYYKNKGEYRKALHWFRIAANLEKSDSLGFVLQDYRGYIPNIESCVCCCALSDFEKAKEYNRLAEQFKPDSEAVKINYTYLSTR